MDLAAEFPGLAQSTYLNSCAHGLLPARTRRAIEAHLQRWTDAPDWNAWNAEIDAARAAFARMIHARPDEVAVLSNASSATSAVMSGFQPGERDELVTLDIDFPASPELAERQRARGFRHTHVREGLLRADDFRRHVSRKTALACIPYVASFTGYKLDVPAFAEAAHAAGAPILVDAFQAAGTIDVDVRKGDVDFLVTGVYKWLMAPAGLAFLYARRDHHSRLPTTAGWQALAEPYSFDPLGPLAPDASRYQQGAPSVLGCVAAQSSLGLLMDVGLDHVAKKGRALVERVMDEARARKCEVLTPPDPADRASIVTFRVPHVERALAALERANVIVNPRLGGIRVSPHFYNSERDVERLFAVLDGVA
jgi:selenocysteine lyase/cysteine desulfurase